MSIQSPKSATDDLAEWDAYMDMLAEQRRLALVAFVVFAIVAEAAIVAAVTVLVTA